MESLTRERASFMKCDSISNSIFLASKTWEDENQSSISFEESICAFFKTKSALFSAS
jgi:hypothetical protein